MQSLKKYGFSNNAGSGFDFLTNLVLAYNYENNANDLSGTGNNGTLVGSPTFPSGKNNLCIDFGNDSTNRYVTIADNDSLSFTNGGGVDVPFTISMWVNFSAISLTGNWLINKRNATSGGDEWQFIYLSGRIEFSKFDRVSNSIIQSGSFPFTPTFGTWYHLVYTDDGSKTFAGMKIYLNGVSQTLTNGSSGVYTGMNNGSSIVAVGINSWSPSQFLKHRGKLDGTLIYKNREFSALEVGVLYDAGAGKFYPF